VEGRRKKGEGEGEDMYIGAFVWSGADHSVVGYISTRRGHLFPRALKSDHWWSVIDAFHCNRPITGTTIVLISTTKKGRRQSHCPKMETGEKAKGEVTDVRVRKEGS